MNIKGLDVSEFQGEIDWEKVKAAGYKFAMLRAGYGYNTVDKHFRRNAAECNRIGLPIGAYWFCYAFSQEKAVQEADGCIRTVSEYRLDYPVCYDIEQASADYIEKQGVSFTPALARNIVKRFCSRIEEKGYYAMFYTNRSFLDTYIGTEPAKRYAFWYARYIKGNVDLDLGYVDYPAVIKKAGLNHLAGDSHTTAPSPSAQYITYVIQPGDTLSEIAKRYGTTVDTLTKLNKISDPNKIYAGNTIRVPENINDK